MGKMNAQWHRDRIEELKIGRDASQTKLFALLTAFLGVYSIVYIVYFYYLDKQVGIALVAIVLIMFFFTYKILKEAKKTRDYYKYCKLRITKNFDVLLDRRK